MQPTVFLTSTISVTVFCHESNISRTNNLQPFVVAQFVSQGCVVAHVLQYSIIVVTWMDRICCFCNSRYTVFALTLCGIDHFYGYFKRGTVWCQYDGLLEPEIEEVSSLTNDGTLEHILLVLNE